MAKRAIKAVSKEPNYAGVVNVEVIVPNVWAGGVKYLLGDTPDLDAETAELLIKNGQAK